MYLQLAYAYCTTDAFENGSFVFYTRKSFTGNGRGNSHPIKNYQNNNSMKTIFT